MATKKRKIILKVDKITKKKPAPYKNKLFSNVSFTLYEGDLIYLIGKKGTGKSTLLKCLYGAEKFDDGEVLFLDKNIGTLHEDEIKKLNSTNVGYMYEYPDIIDYLNLKENIELSNINSKYSKAEIIPDVLEFLDIDFENCNWKDLTFYQMQLVCLARFIVGGIKVVFADEPTAYFNSKEIDLFYQTLKKISDKYGLTFVVATEENVMSSGSKKSVNLLRS